MLSVYDYMIVGARSAGCVLANRRSPLDWAYFTEEQPQLTDRKLDWRRGKVLGGSSSLSAMIYTRADGSAARRPAGDPKFQWRAIAAEWDALLRNAMSRG